MKIKKKHFDVAKLWKAKFILRGWTFVLNRIEKDILKIKSRPLPPLCCNKLRFVSWIYPSITLFFVKMNVS